ncbi:hypothetical protein [Roseobacter fucihabitans]|nr:hypothetical protein [Roseobacter litoralis]
MFILLFATPVRAWEFTPGMPCRLTHETPEVSVELTYDPTQPLYTISLTRNVMWPHAEVFALQFEGHQALSIATDRHHIDKGGKRLTVADHGFKNVLDGLQFNETARAVTGNSSVSIPLAGALGPVKAFRNCAPVAGV